MLKIGDQISILPAFQDKGDEKFTWLVVGDEEKGRVDISPIDINLVIKPIHTVMSDQVSLVKKAPNVETLINSSQHHAGNSETHSPDSGDEAQRLRDHVRASWDLLNSISRKQLLRQPRVTSAIESATGKELRISERMLQENSIEKIFEIFQQQGNKEVSSAEITSLQAVLRTCWDVLKPHQKSYIFDNFEIQNNLEIDEENQPKREFEK